MGTIPAPNIFADSQAIAQAPQNALAEYARVAQLRQQTSDMQTAQQGQQLQNEQAQRALQDQDAVTKAFLNWDHKNPDELATSVVKNGGSATAAQGIQQHYLGIRKTASDMAKQDAETGSALLKTKLESHNQAAGKMAALDNVPDAELPQHLTQTAQELSQSQDPEEKEAAQHIASFAQLPPQQARQQLKVIEHALLGEKEQFNQANEEKKTEIERIKALRLPVDQQELSDYLKDPTIDNNVAQKNAATFAAWKARQNPSYVLAGNMLKGEALDQQAEKYFSSGVLPAGLSRTPGTTTAIISRAAELHPEGNLAANSAEFKANQHSLQNLQKTYDQVSAFEGTALKNLDLYIEKVKAIPDLGARFANVPLRMITGKMIGEKNYAEMQAARQTAATETAKVLGSATASGVLSDSQKKEALDVLDGNLPANSSIGVVGTLKQDFANRHQSYQQQIDDIKKRLGGGEKSQEGGSKATHRYNPATGKIEVIKAQ